MLIQPHETFSFAHINTVNHTHSSRHTYMWTRSLFQAKQRKNLVYTHTWKEQKNFCKVKNFMYCRNRCCAIIYFSSSLRFIYYRKEWKTVKYVLLIKCATILLYTPHTPYKRITISQPVLYCEQWASAQKSFDFFSFVCVCVFLLFFFKNCRVNEAFIFNILEPIFRARAHSTFSILSVQSTDTHTHVHTYNIQIACDNAWTKCDHFCSWLPKKFLLLQTNFQETTLGLTSLTPFTHTHTYSAPYQFQWFSWWSQHIPVNFPPLKCAVWMLFNQYELQNERTEFSSVQNA